MKIFLYPFFALMILTTTVWGQGFGKYYLPTHSQFKDVVNTTDGGYFMAGGTTTDSTLFLQRVGPTGGVIWAKHLSLNGAQAIAACAASDGGFGVLVEGYATAQGQRNIILKINSNGDIEWQTQLGNPLLANGLRDLIQTSDGQFLAAGDIRDAQLRENIWLVKLDLVGSVVWSKSVGDTLYNEHVSRLLELPDGQIVVSGDVLHDADRDLFLAKTDLDGNLLWQKWYARPNVQNAYDLAALSDGGLAMLAETYGEDPAKIILLRTDGDGVIGYYRDIATGLAFENGSPYTLFSSFATDVADNFFVPIASADQLSGYTSKMVLQKFDVLGEPIWSKPLGIGLPQQIIRTPGGHFAVVGGDDDDANNYGAFLVVTDAFGEIYNNEIVGSLYHDENDNCVQDGNEPYLSQFLVRAENELGDVFFNNSLGGGFSIPVPVGHFTVSVHPRYAVENFWVPCDTQMVTVTGPNQTIYLPALGLRSVAKCPLLEVEIGSAFIRRCMTSVLDVYYCNNGSLHATNASVQITPDPHLTYQSSTLPLTSQNGNVLVFNLPDVPLGNCDDFKITFSVSCDVALGEVLCTEAHIFPDSVCLPYNGLWDGSHLVVSGSCNSEVAFTIRNAGMSNMNTATDYVIIEDQIMYLQGQVQLDAGEDTVIVVPTPSGDAYQLRIHQSIGHPGKSQPSATVSACAGADASNLLLQLPQDEADAVIATHCDEVIGSFDPNDKRGFPLGWQAEHIIERGQELEYMIRFQNTGTDTAFLVIVRDTMSPLLDMTSLRVGASSHPYTYFVNETGILTFRFANILLPDSNINETASHGYVLFRLRQQPDLAFGEVIENRAGIYFDFNAPVLTNTTFHTIGHPFIIVRVNEPTDYGLDLRVFPNPLADQVTFQVQGLPVDSHFQWSLYDVHGALVRQEQFVGTNFQFQRDALLPGVYFFQLTEKNGRTARGKIVVR